MNRSRPITFLASGAAILLIAVGVASCGGSSDKAARTPRPPRDSRRRPPWLIPLQHLAAKPAPAPAPKPVKKASPPPPPAPAPQPSASSNGGIPQGVTWATTMPTTTAAPMTATEASSGEQGERTVGDRRDRSRPDLVVGRVRRPHPHGDQRSQGPSAGAFAWLRPAPAPADWNVARISGGATLSCIRPDGGRFKTDPGTATAGLLRGGDEDDLVGYLNATPRQGDETLENWASFPAGPQPRRGRSKRAHLIASPRPACPSGSGSRVPACDRRLHDLEGDLPRDCLFRVRCRPSAVARLRRHRSPAGTRKSHLCAGPFRPSRLSSAAPSTSGCRRGIPPGGAYAKEFSTG